MNDLSPQEQNHSEALHAQALMKIKFPAIITIVYLTGGFLGWMSILLFLSAIGFDVKMLGFLGVLLMLLAFYSDKNQSFDPLYILSMMILGHAHLMVALVDSFSLGITSIFFIEALIFVITFVFYRSMLYRALQFSLLLGLLFALPFEHHMPQSAYGLLVASLILLSTLWLYPHKALLFMRPLLMVGQTLYAFVLFMAPLHAWQTFDLIHTQTITALILGLIFMATLLLIYPKLRRNLYAYLASIFVILLAVYGSIGLVLSLIFLLLSTFTHERYLRILSVLLLGAFIFYYYYTLQLPLDQKGLVLMASGLLILAFALILKFTLGKKYVA